MAVDYPLRNRVSRYAVLDSSRLSINNVSGMPMTVMPDGKEKHRGDS